MFRVVLVFYMYLGVFVLLGLRGGRGWWCGCCYVFVLCGRWGGLRYGKSVV